MDLLRKAQILGQEQGGKMQNLSLKMANGKVMSITLNESNLIVVAVTDN